MFPLFDGGCFITRTNPFENNVIENNKHQQKDRLS